VAWNGLKSGGLRSEPVKGRTAWLVLAVAGLLLALSPIGARAQEEEPLRVGVSHHPPLAIRFEEGWDGVAVQLWEDIARDLDVNYEWVELPAGEETEAIRVGRVDLVITATATAEGEQELDFSHSYFSSSLGFVESAERQVVEIVRGILTPGFWRTAALVVLVLLVMGSLTWLLERRQNAEDFGGGWLRGLWSGFWFAAVTLTAVGYGDKVPKTIAGRLVALFWMLIALGIAATLTARIISAVALRAETGFTFPEDLHGVMVGAVRDSLSADYLGQEGIEFAAYASTEEGLRAVDAGEIRVFVDEVAALRYYGGSLFGGEVGVTVARAGVQEYVFALPPAHALLEPINQALLRHIQSDGWPDLLRRYGAAAGP
jgi:ABC-type amino acid transport substrate-binding protein